MSELDRITVDPAVCGENTPKTKDASSKGAPA